MDQLIYKSLQHQEIRILTLKPGSDSDLVECSLEHAFLDDNPRYYALSYAWGDPTITQKILVDGKTLPVTVNLFAALENFRAPELHVRLWVDAICVNQCNLSERSQQVKLMRRVFSQARHTLVWLGIEENDSNTAMDLLESNLSEDRDSQDFEQKLIALEQLFQRPWWFRIWIVQEVVVSSEVSYFCGKRQITWSKIIDAYSLFLAGIAIEVDLWGCIERIISINDIFTAYNNVEHIDRDNQMSMLCLMAKHRRSLASDPRDKCIALMGLSNNADAEGIDNLYSIPVEDVYISTMVNIANRAKRGPLNFLSYSGQPRTQELLPSWVADWSCSKVLGVTFPHWQLEWPTEVGNPLDRFEVVGAFDICGRSVFQFHDNNRTLLASGFLFDKIDGCASTNGQSPQGLFPGRSDGSDSHLQQPIHKHHRYPTKESIDDVLWRTFFVNRNDHGGHFKGESCERWKSLFNSLFAAIITDNQMGGGNDTTHDTSSGKTRSQILESYKRFTSVSTEWWNQNKGLKICDEKTLGDVIRRNQTSNLIEFSIEDIDRCAGCIVVAIGGKRLSVSDKGYLCIVPAYSEHGDIITVLLGCDVPVVLRKHADTYECIGVCYVHGIMQGEAMAGIDTGEFEIQEFNIR